MPTTRKQSGFFIEAANPSGKYEMVLPIADMQWPITNNRLCKFGNDRNLCDESVWRSAEYFGDQNLLHGPASLIQSSFGYLEVVASHAGGLVHYWKAPIFGWSAPTRIGENGDGANGNPAFIQSGYGRAGNFEVVAPGHQGGLVHYWRDNDPTWTQPWSAPTYFGSGNIWGVALIHSSYGNLEVVAVNQGRLDFYWRAPNGWQGPFPIGNGAGRQPGFIQSRFGATGNFEVVVPNQAGGLSHYWRDNDDPNKTWHGPFNFGGPTLYSRASLIQEDDGSLRVFAKVAGRNHQMAIFSRLSGPPWTWTQQCAPNILDGDVPLVPPPPPPDHFEIRLEGDWSNYITADTAVTAGQGGITVIATTPGGIVRNYTLSDPAIGAYPNHTVPLSDGGLGTWTLAMHIEGMYRDSNTRTQGAVVSPVQTFDWQTGNPIVIFTANVPNPPPPTNVSWSFRVVSA